MNPCVKEYQMSNQEKMILFFDLIREYDEEIYTQKRVNTLFVEDSEMKDRAKFILQFALDAVSDYAKKNAPNE